MKDGVDLIKFAMDGILTAHPKGLVAAFTIVALWPSIWVNPFRTPTLVLQTALNLAEP